MLQHMSRSLFSGTANKTPSALFTLSLISRTTCGVLTSRSSLNIGMLEISASSILSLGLLMLMQALMRPLLVEFFLKDLNERFNKEVKPPGNDVMRRLMGYDWPGNVRELRNAIERAVVLSRDGNMHVENLFRHLQKSSAQINTCPSMCVCLRG